MLVVTTFGRAGRGTVADIACTRAAAVLVAERRGWL
jgi:hypothetical protein